MTGPLLLKKLRIVCDPNADEGDYVGARFFEPLLAIANGVETLQELVLLDTVVEPMRSNGVVSWPVAFASYPNLGAKLVKLTVQDEDVPLWAEIDLPNLRNVDLVVDWFGGVDKWRSIDAFPGLWELSISDGFDTRDLVDWAFRDLEELIVRRCMLRRDCQHFDSVRNLIDRNLKLRIKLYLPSEGGDDAEEEFAWEIEKDFWLTLKSQVTLLDEFGRVIDE
jgi:hypothetical protein